METPMQELFKKFGHLLPNIEEEYLKKEAEYFDVKTKKVQVARCPSCNDVVLISVFPQGGKHHNDQQDEWLKLLNAGYTIVVEPYKEEKIKWCNCDKKNKL